MHGASRSAILLVVGIILCIYAVCAAPTRHQTQMSARKRIFCNFAGCGSKRSRPSPMDESYKLLQNLRDDDSIANHFNRDISDFSQEAASAESLSNAPKLEYNSQVKSSDDSNLSALRALRELSRDRKVIQEAVMWEILLEKLRQDKSSEN